MPVGLEFYSLLKFRQILTVSYGEPIGFEDLYDTYRENPQVAMNRLRDKISAGIKKLIIHIESEEDYEALNEIRDIINGKHSRDRKYPKLQRDRELIEKLVATSESDPDLYRDICNRVLKIKNICEQLNIGYFHLDRSKPRVITHLLAMAGLVLLFPLFIYR
ncbi:MAG: hypothetical protein R2744_06275 [Bacteroidales bacterium]